MRSLRYWLGAVFCLGGGVATLQFSCDDRWGWPYLISEGPGNLLDLWVLVHCSVGVVLAKGFFIQARRYFGVWWRPKIVCLVLTLALSWEGLELTLEAGAAGEAVRHWFGGHEHWMNRLIVDPLTPVLSITAWRYFPRIWYAAAVFLVGWWAVLSFMPNAMGIDDNLLRLMGTSTQGDNR